MGGNGGVKLCVLWAKAVVRTKQKVGWGVVRTVRREKQKKSPQTSGLGVCGVCRVLVNHSA